MPTVFRGFSSIDANGKFTLTGSDLVKRDLLNAFSIRQGQLVGKPSYGTTVWDLLFEAQIPETQARIQEEIQRVVGTDPRLYLNGVNVYPQDNGVLIEVLVTFVSSTEPERLLVFFNPSSRQASYV